jgi:hypothetical protein
MKSVAIIYNSNIPSEIRFGLLNILIKNYDEIQLIDLSTANSRVNRNIIEKILLRIFNFRSIVAEKRSNSITHLSFSKLENFKEFLKKNKELKYINLDPHSSITKILNNNNIKFISAQFCQSDINFISKAVYESSFIRFSFFSSSNRKYLKCKTKISSNIQNSKYLYINIISKILINNLDLILNSDFHHFKDDESKKDQFKELNILNILFFIIKKNTLRLSIRIRNRINKLYIWKIGFNIDDIEYAPKNISGFISSLKNDHLADPFLFKKDQRYFCFLECYNSKSIGEIHCYELVKNNFEFKGIALKESFHLSYPFIFEYQDQIYMCPESSDNNDIRLYKCENFPLQWKLEKILFKNIQACDTNIFYKNHYWWLQTSISVDKDSKDFLLHNLYYSTSPISDQWEAHQMNPIHIDSSLSRNGGFVIKNQDICRISQDFGYDNYGESFSIQEIKVLNRKEYEEIEVNIDTVTKHGLRFIDEKKLLGYHHFNMMNNSYVYDFKIKPRLIDIFKVKKFKISKCNVKN